MVSIELFQMRRRVGAWVLLGIWCTLAVFFGYILPYLIDDGAQATRVPAGAFAKPALLPDQFVSTVIEGFPFYGGAIALMLGVLTVGSEFGWGTFKTLFTQRPGRGEVFAAKMAALAIVLVPFVALVFALGAGASSLVALREGLPMTFPGPMEIVAAMLAGWLILVTWAAVGVLLAVATRGTSLAIGIGILYALVIEGLISAFANQISWLEPVINVVLRANAYSLVEPFSAGAAPDGPGAFAGPYLGVTQSLVALAACTILGFGIAAWLLRVRDVE